MNILFLLSDIGSQLKKRLVVFITFSIMFVIGVMSGIIIDKPVAIDCYYLNYCDNYIYRIFSESPGGIFTDRILTSALFIALVIPTALSIYCVPLQGLLVFYKGFVFGSVTVILFSVYRFSGFLVWLLVLLPQTLLFAIVYIILSVLAFDCGCENRSRRDFHYMKTFFVYFLTAIIAALLCALVEFLFICFIFRPVSKVL